MRFFIFFSLLFSGIWAKSYEFISSIETCLEANSINRWLSHTCCIYSGISSPISLCLSRKRNTCCISVIYSSGICHHFSALLSLFLCMTRMRSLKTWGCFLKKGLISFVFHLFGKKVSICFSISCDGVKSIILFTALVVCDTCSLLLFFLKLSISVVDILRLLDADNTLYKICILCFFLILNICIWFMVSER